MQLKAYNKIYMLKLCMSFPVHFQDLNSASSINSFENLEKVA